MADIKLIARILSLSIGADMRKTVKTLKEEYGIETVAEEHKINEVAEQNNDLERAKNGIITAQKRLSKQKKSKPYTPRKIGKPCGFPKNMRRK